MGGIVLTIGRRFSVTPHSGRSCPFGVTAKLRFIEWVALSARVRPV